MNGEQTPGRYFAHAPDYLNLCILCMLTNTFSLGMAHMINFLCQRILSSKITFGEQDFPQATICMKLQP